ncbi:conserved hypothetical protein [gamma proteobacterium HTCC5015]|nr:conserved hypothetical protein [gamma proteobacterium HTCC5015]
MKRVVLSCLLGLLSQPALALYKWVDEEGNVHYSDRLPPEQVSDQHTEIDQSGVQVRQVDRAKSQEEYAAEQAAAKAEAERKAKEKAVREAQERKDRILLDTFTTVRDIEMLREDRVSAIASNIKLTQTYNEQITEKLANTRQKIERLEKAGREVPENLIKQVERSENQLRENEAYIARQIKERKALEAQFKQDSARFRELKGLPPLEEESASNSESAEEGEAEPADTEASDTP